MNKIQKTILYIYITMTIIFIILDNFFPGQNFVNHIKFVNTISLFVFALCIKKRCREHMLMTFALFFIVLGDFFLVFCKTIPNLSFNAFYFGVASFIFSYLFLIIAFQKKVEFSIKEVISLILVLAIFTINFYILHNYISGIVFYGLILFSIVICYMTWTCVCTIFRCYFRLNISLLIAISGVLILISDIAVIHSVFNPAFSGQFVPWLKNIVWGTYVPAWMIMLFVMGDSSDCQTIVKQLFNGS